MIVIGIKEVVILGKIDIDNVILVGDKIYIFWMFVYCGSKDIKLFL